MTDEEQAALNAENQTINTESATDAVKTDAAALDAAAPDAAKPDAAATDANNFGEDSADNFGGEAEAASGFEDNFGLGDQQLSAGTIPSPPMPKRKEPAPPVTPRNREAESLSGIASGPAVNAGTGPAQGEGKPDRKLTREEDLFERFQLLRVPENFCQYTMWFRSYLFQHPDALKKLEPMLCDEASVAAVRLGIKRLGAFPSPEFRNISFYYPMGMSTEDERKDWQEHVKRFPEYAKLANGKYPYFDPSQFYYRHGVIYLDKAVTDRLEGGIFYQCGAFCGASAIVMNQYNPSKMYAFEPALGNTLFLQQNVTRADLKKLEIYNLFIGDQQGKVVLKDRDREGKPCKTEAPVATLDFFEQKKSVPGRVAWIQADVNGMSLRVVRGAEKMIKRDKPLITVAIYHNPEEFFGIVPLLHEWVPEYKFMVRRCQCNPRITYSEITLIAYIP